MDGFASPKQNVQRAKELKLNAIGVSNHGSISGAVEHWEACKKNKIKCILGNELYITHKPACIKTPENRNRTHMVVFAKNYEGWRDLIKLTSQTNHPDYFYYKPRIYPWDYTDENGKFWPGLESFTKGNIIGISGHQGSMISDFCFFDPYGGAIDITNLRKAYTQKRGMKTDYYEQFLKPNWLESTCDIALKLEKLFGKGNFFIELQNELDPNDTLALYIHPLIVKCLREVSIKTGIPAIASADSHYAIKEQSVLQRIMLATSMKETEASIEAKLSGADDEQDVMVFFGSDNFYIHSPEEMSEKFTKTELEQTNVVAAMVEEYSIIRRPYIPRFSVPEVPKEKSHHLTEIKNPSDQYLMHLCVEGAKKLQPWKTSKINKQVYWDRLQDETKGIFSVGLSDYFLVVDDICKAADFRPKDHSFDWQKNKGEVDPITRGCGRGSSSGCLISYLTGITGIDPVKHDLVFSRFFNVGRCSGDHMSLPDIDLDFQTGVSGRDWIIEYIRHKYGHDKVGQIITFSTIKGRSAIKDVFRIKAIEGGFDLANKICDCIAQESVIADEIQQMKNEGDQGYNILRWTLDNVAQFQEYYKNPKLKELIDLSMKCEGVLRGSGRHPSGIVVANEPLENIFPMVYDPKSKQRIVGFDLKSAEKMGAAKFDILGVAILSKLKMTEELVHENYRS